MRVLKKAEHVVFSRYCPRHEFEWWECCACCDDLKVVMWRIDDQLFAYWWDHGYIRQRAVA